MFAARYFNSRYFAPRYFVGTSVIDVATCTVTIVVLDQSGVPVENAIVRTWLEDANPVAGSACISRAKSKVLTDSSGRADVTMIQFAQFSRGGTYILQISDADGRRLRESRVRVPTLNECYANQLTEI